MLVASIVAALIAICAAVEALDRISRFYNRCCEDLFGVKLLSEKAVAGWAGLMALCLLRRHVALRKIIESAQPFSSKMHSRFHRRCTLIFMTVHTQGAVLRAHARVDIGV